MRMWLALLLAWSASAFGAPFIVSDVFPPSTDLNPNPTHCTYTLNGGARVPDVPVETTATGIRCRFDISGVTSGTQTMVAYAVVIDGFGRKESDPSAPFVFTPSGRPSAPSGLRITP